MSFTRLVGAPCVAVNDRRLSAHHRVRVSSASPQAAIYRTRSPRGADNNEGQKSARARRRSA
eukprot:6306370-Prymnesium_polylepis.2